MRKRMLALVMFLLFAALLSPEKSSAQSITVTLTPGCNGQATQTLQGSGSVTIVAAGTTMNCGSNNTYQITNVSTGNATVTATDTTGDVLQLLNLKITKVAADSEDFNIVLWSDNFQTPPSDSGSTGYSISARGTFWRGTSPLTAATGDSIGFSGYTQMPTGGTWDALSSLSYPQYVCTVGATSGISCSGNNIPSTATVKKVYTPPQHPLSLKGDVWLHLADPASGKQDSLSLTAVQLQNYAPGGPPHHDEEPLAPHKKGKK